MTIVEALENLKVEGMNGDNDHIIETVLSKLFVRGDEVHKAYKHRIALFGDLTKRDVRKKFISDDFAWNNVMSPEIYLELRHVAVRDGAYAHVDPESAEDHYIVMRRIDPKKGLVLMLESGEIKPDDLARYVASITDRLRILEKMYASQLQEYIDRGTAHVKDEIVNTCNWAYTADPFLLPDDVDRAKTLFLKTFESETYLKDGARSSVVIDTNPDNIFFIDGSVSFLDVMPPRDSWRIHDPYFIICRTSADVSIHDPALAEALHHEYAKREVLPSKAVRTAYEIAGALIQVPYRKLVGQTVAAEKYGAFVKRRMDLLEELLSGR